ncbi:MAG: hypothetical protein DMF06_11550 [Verrucomicrobia bacterium]|nr:MAG: hypothetical protein DMF06_11550 [Verrucomicrobiota bacterium]
MLTPFAESSLGHYSRLFPPAAPCDDFEASRAALSALACAMVDDGTRVSEERPEILLEAGYTYFGQFVAHDLTKDVSSVDDAWRKEPHEIENQQTPRLDLGVLYGAGPETSGDLYEDDGVRLKVAAAAAGARSFDICTNHEGAGLLADDRGASNSILRQMTAVFARLHNFAVEQFRPTARDRVELFARAQQQLRWQFQWLVCKDYLPNVLNREVCNRVIRAGQGAIQWNTFSIPIEFSAAAMRFGHAMVRPNYLLSMGQEMLLPKILGRLPDRGALEAGMKINWGLFFQGAGEGAALTTRPIDTRLALPLQQLPADLIGVAEVACPHHRIEKNPAQLPLRTLIRGAGLRLASGQTAARAFGEPVLSEAELTQDSRGRETEQGRILRQANLLHETPLWYYILKESEVRENGNRVGPVGSNIVAETIQAALRFDPDSYLNRSEAGPPVWHFPDGPTQIRGLSELFRRASDL